LKLGFKSTRQRDTPTRYAERLEGGRLLALPVIHEAEKVVTGDVNLF